MKVLKGVLGSAYLFFTIMIANLVQTLSLIIKPFSNKLFRKINRETADIWWGSCDSMAKRAHDIQIKLSNDTLPQEENAIVMINHQVMTDIPVMFELAKSKNRLGDMKYFVKDIIKYFPGIGWGMLFLDCIFLKRDWLKDKEKIKATFSRIVDNQIPVWVVNFVEGTRFTPEKSVKSRAYSKKMGLPEFKNVLTPRTKGLVAAIQGLRGHVTAVYDFTIGYHKINNLAPTLWQWIKGDVKEVHLHIRRYPVKEIPSQDQDIALWIIERFKEKDELLEHFYNLGHF